VSLASLLVAEKPKGGPMLVAGDKRVRGRGCPILGADWERRSCASCGQTPSDAASGRQVNASDVRKCRRAGVLLALALSSGRRGRRFKSGHPDPGHSPLAITAGGLFRALRD